MIKFKQSVSHVLTVICWVRGALTTKLVMLISQRGRPGKEGLETNRSRAASLKIYRVGESESLTVIKYTGRRKGSHLSRGNYCSRTCNSNCFSSKLGAAGLSSTVPPSILSPDRKTTSLSTDIYSKTNCCLFRVYCYRKGLAKDLSEIRSY